MTGMQSGIDSYLSWRWAHSHPKHVEKRNKHTKKIVHQVGCIYKILKNIRKPKSSDKCFNAPTSEIIFKNWHEHNRRYITNYCKIVKNILL